MFEFIWRERRTTVAPNEIRRTFIVECDFLTQPDDPKQRGEQLLKPWLTVEYCRAEPQPTEPVLSGLLSDELRNFGEN